MFPNFLPLTVNWFNFYFQLSLSDSTLLLFLVGLVVWLIPHHFLFCSIFCFAGTILRVIPKDTQGIKFVNSQVDASYAFVSEWKIWNTKFKVILYHNVDNFALFSTHPTLPRPPQFLETMLAECGLSDKVSLFVSL